MKKLIILLAIAALSGCQGTRTETFQGETIKLAPGEEFVKTRHQHNFELWQKNEAQRIGGNVSKKAVEICPTDQGHGPRKDEGRETFHLMLDILF